MKRKLWTARVITKCGVELMAQHKSSKVALMKRLIADDSVWSNPTVRMSYESRLDNKQFKRGLALKGIR